MKFGLLSVTYSGLFYSGKSLTIEEQIIKARELGFDGLSIEAKRPIASPLDLNKTDRIRIRKVAEKEDIELIAIESLSNFSSDFMEDRENNLAMMLLQLELAKDLGINLVKIFAAWPGILNDKEEVALYGPFERGAHYKRLYPDGLRKWTRAVEGIREVADRAADLGITIAIQNHAPVITPGYEDVLEMKKEVGRENLKFCLDVPLFYDRQETSYIKEDVNACGKDIVLTHYGAWNFSETAEEKVIQTPASSFGGLINYEAYISELNKINYQGYLVSEYCLPVYKNHKIAGIEAIDLGTSRGLKYIKNLVSKTSEVSVV